MRWLPNISFTSSSTSTSSSLKSPNRDSLNQNNNNNNNNSNSNNNISNNRKITDEIAGTWRFGPIRKLTRQRKLRHLSDHDVGEVSSSSRMEPLALVRSPTHSDCMPARSSLVKPQPLPLPELGIFRGKESSSPGYVDFPLPSPKTGPSRVGVDDRDRDRACSNSPIKRYKSFVFAVKLSISFLLFLIFKFMHDFFFF